MTGGGLCCSTMPVKKHVELRDLVVDGEAVVSSQVMFLMLNEAAERSASSSMGAAMSAPMTRWNTSASATVTRPTPQPSSKHRPIPGKVDAGAGGERFQGAHGVAPGLEELLAMRLELVGLVARRSQHGPVRPLAGIRGKDRLGPRQHLRQ